MIEGKKDITGIPMLYPIASIIDKKGFVVAIPSGYLVKIKDFEIYRIIFLPHHE